jgi:hypothetical protein
LVGSISFIGLVGSIGPGEIPFGVCIAALIKQKKISLMG